LVRADLDRHEVATPRILQGLQQVLPVLGISQHVTSAVTINRWRSATMGGVTILLFPRHKILIYKFYLNPEKQNQNTTRQCEK